jgi:acetyl-CoA C-acetyltransferase
MLSQEIMLGKVDIGAVVGVESMSNAPYLLFGARKGYRLADGERIQDSLMIGGLVDELLGYHMGITADNIADQYGISRQEQDEYAMMSNQGPAMPSPRAGSRMKSSRGGEDKKGNRSVRHGRTSMANTSMEVLGKLKHRPSRRTAPLPRATPRAQRCRFLPDSHGRRNGGKMGIKPIARVVASAPGSVEPRIMGMGVVPAVRNALKFAGLKQDQIDYWEFNEAFAALVLG